MFEMSIKQSLIIYSTFVIALILAILPLPSWAIWMRPAWVPLVLIYWELSLPHRIGIGTAWIMGILLDALNGTLIGEHALGLIVIAYLTLKFYRQIRVFPLWQQAMTVAVFLVLYEILLLIVQGFVNALGVSAQLWLSIIISALLWPWLAITLRSLRQRFMIY